MKRYAMGKQQPPATDWAEKDEKAWLIERDGLCLGISCRYFRWMAFTDIQALHFSRRSDAIRFIEAMRETLRLELENVLVTEHMWVKP